MLKRLISLFLLLTLGVACEKQPPIPIVETDITISLYDPEFRSLASIGNVVTIVGGSRGIIVKRTGLNEFTAFDQHCPYDPEEATARVSLEEGSIDFVICKSCSTRYNLYFGNPEVSEDETEKKYPLLGYRTNYYESVNTLRIRN